jgi:Domain of unknown function (DUF4280)
MFIFYSVLCRSKVTHNKEIGATFEKNTFGPCKKQPIPGGHKPCQAIVTEWSNFYQEVTLSNQGKILLEDSKASCPIGGKDCIKITFHGQVAAPSDSQAKSEKKEVMAELNPVVDMNDFEEDDAPFYT